MLSERNVLSRVLVVGRSRAGTALLRALRAAAVDAGSVPGRLTVARAVPRRGLADATLLVVAVPDRFLEATAEALGSLLESLPARPAVLHLSGARGASALAPLSRRGFPAGACHPFQTLPEGTGPDAFRGVVFDVEGDAAALAAARALASRLGGLAVEVPPAARPLLHMAATLASGGTVGLLAAATDAFAAAGIGEETALRALAPLVRASVENALAAGPDAALTGPVARGDDATLRAHREAVSAWDPDRRGLYEALVAEQERVARRTRR